ncbi:MAG TPA: TolC family protein [Gemmatimonadales bacterium]
MIRRFSLGAVLSSVGVAFAAAGFAGAAVPARLAAQDAAGRPLSLEEALSIGARTSESVGIARAGVDRARGQQRQARSEYFPQLTGTASYTRTLRSQFSVLADTGSSSEPPPPECRRFIPDPAAPIEERVDSLEAALECASRADPFAAFADLPFGQENQYNLGLQASQLLFAGGRVRAQNRIAGAGRRLAEIELASQEAQNRLEVAEAYFDALLGDRLVSIADSTLAQAERTLENTRLALEVGNVPEFELLRAQVIRDNARPVVIQRRAQRDIAYLRLKQLLELPAGDSLVLTTPLDSPADSMALAATAVERRAAVRQAEENVVVQEGRLAVARAASWPTLRLTSNFSRFGYPDDLLPAWSDFVSDWNVALSLSVPLFTGGRLSGDRMVARADVDEARLRLAATRELAALDVETAEAALRAADAAWSASAGTVEQAQRAYAIAEVRFQEGISTQTELGDARVQLQQALANRAQSARDLRVARLRIELLDALPLGTAGR